MKYKLNEINRINLNISGPSIIYLNWWLWAWKTTISKYLINDVFWVEDIVTSPTYVYYNKYISVKFGNIYHFDLYRLNNYDEFCAIWWEDVFENNSWIIIVEWPDIIKDYIKADTEIFIEKTEDDLERELKIIQNVKCKK